MITITPYIPWFLCITLILQVEPVTFCSNTNGFNPSVFRGTASFTKLTSADEPVNEALFNLNLRSLFCSGVQVEALAEVKNTPSNGCLVILYQYLFN